MAYHTSSNTAIFADVQVLSNHIYIHTYIRKYIYTLPFDYAVSVGCNTVDIELQTKVCEVILTDEVMLHLNTKICVKQRKMCKEDKLKITLNLHPYCYQNQPPL